MMPSLKRISIRPFSLGVAAVCLLFVAGLLYWGPRYVEGLLNRQDFGTRFNEATGGTFTSSRLRFHFLPRPHALIPDGRITIPDRLNGQWQTARAYPALSALLSGQFRISRVVLQNPDFDLRLPRAASIDPAAPQPGTPGTLQKAIHEWLAQLVGITSDTTIEVRNGALTLLGMDETPVDLANVHLDLQLTHQQLEVDLRCRANHWKSMRLNGFLDPDALRGKLDLDLKQFDPIFFTERYAVADIQWQSAPMDIRATADLVDGHHASAVARVQIPDLQLQGHPERIQVKGIRVDIAMDYSPLGFQVELVDLTSKDPSLTLSGKAHFSPHPPRYQVELMGRDISIDPWRKAALALAGEDEVVSGIFDVLRGGSVPWIRFSTRGQAAVEMAEFRNMTIAGLVEKGRLFIPEANLDLTDVHGKADISHGILKGTDLKASFGKTAGTGGRLWLDFGQEENLPFFLEIDVDADLEPLPALLGQWVDDPAFRGEIRRIRHISGTAAGRLVVDGRQKGLDVTVDATRCRFDAEYDRLPAPLSVSEGMVQYTADRIQVVQMSGRIATTDFSGLAGHVVFGDRPLLQVDTAAARLDMDQIAPWLTGYGALDALPFRLESSRGTIVLERLALNGPLLTPAQWAVDTLGSLQGLRFLSAALPGPAHIASARFSLSPDRLEIPEAHLLMADADLAIEDARFRFRNRHPIAAAVTISGQTGAVSSNWIGDHIALGKPWRLKTPITLSTAELTWSAEGEKTARGKMITGGGTHLSLDVRMKGNTLRHQSLVVDDADSHAEMKVAFWPDKLEIGFDGRISSATISRMMQEKHQHTGHMEGQFQALIYPRNPGSSTISGSLKAYDIHQPLGIPQSHLFKELSLEARDNQVLISPAVIVVEDQLHRITGSIDIEDNGYVLDLVHAATHMRLSLPEATPAEARPPEAEAYSVWELPLRGRVRSRSETFTMGQLQWSPFNATVRLDPGNWHLRIEDASLCGISTRGDVRISPENVSIALMPLTQDGSFDGSMTCLMEKPNLIDGRFDLTGHLSVRGPPDRLARSVNGQLELHARKGRIYRFNLLSKALALVNVTELFRGKLPDLMQDGLAYESIHIQVDIEDSLCTIREAVIDGASANIAGQGTIDLVTSETDMIVLVAPFKTVDALVRFTPVIGDWLGGTLISIPVGVTGAFSDPNVTPLSPSAVGSSLMGLMKKTIGLPIKIVQPLWEDDD